MADILIRGTYFPFPRNGYRVFRIYADGRVEGETGVSLGAAAELPEHGDLVDRSELNNSFESSDFDGEPHDNVYSAICVVNSMPVIIPSNKENKNAN